MAARRWAFNYPNTIVRDRTSGLRIGLVVADLDRLVNALRSWGAAVVAESAAAVSVIDTDGHQIALEQEGAAG
jgi:hypothetical protein